MSNLLETIKEDLQQVYFKHVILWLAEVEDYMKEYPSISKMNFASISLTMDGDDIRENTSYTDSRIDRYNSDGKVRRFYLLTENAKGQQLRVYDLFQRFGQLKLSLQAMNQNGAQTSSDRGVILSAKKFSEDIKTSFGQGVYEYYSSTKEKEQLSDMVASAKPGSKSLKI